MQAFTPVFTYESHKYGAFVKLNRCIAPVLQCHIAWLLAFVLVRPGLVAYLIGGDAPRYAFHPKAVATLLEVWVIKVRLVPG